MAFKLRKNKEKWAMVGTGNGWENLPLKSDHTIFCLNDFIFAEKYQIQPDLLAIMDLLDEKPKIVSGIDNLGEVVSRINKMGIPLVAPYKYAEIPLSEAFPLEEAAKKFGTLYFSNTIAYMVCYALLQGAKEIEFFGVNQAGAHEYTEEKGSVEYWIGIAVGMGVKVTINGKDSQLLKHKGRYGKNILYGYLTDYEGFLRDKERFGEGLVKRLSLPTPNVARVARRVNHSS